MSGQPLFPWSVVRALLVAIALIVPLMAVLRRAEKKGTKLTWTTATILGGYLLMVTIILIGDVPSRLLYWFDQTHAPLAAKFGFLKWWENPNFGGNVAYQVVADIVANSVQGIFFVIICVAAYFWGERHRKEGKFKS